MKKVILLSTLFLISLGFLLKKGINDEQIQPSTLAVAENASEAVFTVLVEAGNVYFGDGNKYTIINQPNVELPNNTYVKTEDGTAQLILKDNSVITLDKFTSVQIVEDSSSTKLRQLYGKTWNRIKDITKLGEFKVETNNTIAAVRGTVFGVTVDKEDNTDVYVVESGVEITKGVKTENGWRIIEEQELDVGTNAYVINPEATPIVTNKIAEEFKETDWYKSNRSLDSVVMQAKTRRNILNYLKSARMQTENRGIDLPNNVPTKNVLSESTEFIGGVSGDKSNNNSNADSENDNEQESSGNEESSNSRTNTSNNDSASSGDADSGDTGDSGSDEDSGGEAGDLGDSQLSVPDPLY